MAASPFVLKAEPRAERGKEKARKIRQAARVPAVVYGSRKEERSISLDTREFETVRQRTHGEKVLLTLEYADGGSDRVFIQSIQRNPMTQRLLHVDFYRVDMSRPITVRVPVICLGVPEGVKTFGGMLDMVAREVEIKCLPDRVPPHIEVAVDHLGIGQSIHVSDLPRIDGIEYVSLPSVVICAVHGKGKEEDAPAADAAAPAAAAAAAAAPAKGAAPAKAAPAAAPAKGAAPAAKPAAKK
jgi:large subunit ribosomal protein L25